MKDKDPSDDGIGPASLFELTAKYEQYTNDPSDDGIVPTNEFKCRFMVSRFVSLPSALGKLPFRLFCCSCRVFKPYSCPNELGREPASRLPFRFSARTGSAPPVHTTPVHVHTLVVGTEFTHTQPEVNLDFTDSAAAKSHSASVSGTCVGAAEGSAVGSVEG